MKCILQPILSPVKGAPDITVSTAANEYIVFIGLALLEKVPVDQNHPAFKMLLARLYNARMSGRTLSATFGVSRSTLQRWGIALKSGDWDEILRAMAGQGAPRKVTPEIERYACDRYHELKNSLRNYNQVIREEIERYFNAKLSSERVRQIFAGEREKQLCTAEVADAEFVLLSPDILEPSGEPLESNSCEVAFEALVNTESDQGSRNYSIPPPAPNPADE
jgi:transposase